MPELPEVEVVRAGLAPAVTGAMVTRVDVLDARALTRHDQSVGDFENLLTGSVIAAAVRRGKFLWFPCGHGRAVVVHLGMSGQLLLRSPDAPTPPRHLRLQLHLHHPSHGELRIDFVDQRTFGSFAIDRMVPSGSAAPAGYSAEVTGGWASMLPSQVAHIARDPLDPAFDDAAFIARLRARRAGVKRLLLDQTLISGIGNIYADEALWAVKLHPEQPTSTITPRRARDLLAAVRSVFERALAEGGTSFDAQYVNVNGASGYFAHSLDVYGRTGQPCRRCGALIVREQFMNRSSHRCPKCQRLR
ncbi:MAG TPA: bifunctional DNA-formamidopyrimidine glycosylase/DNA-(apurinic or apyrimidinic site) lyase [Candidatus Lumbricidophila sp.]|nr:bifunctional DNA-formamidopyrimidine glycosylase/DNA-(apurinic or apyrimidinic site) lyase [Candidatus Lumbricidophila sp.]